MKQKEAVYALVMAFEGFQADSKDHRARVIDDLVIGFRAGEIDLDREYDDKGLRNYCSGLLSNWLRKDERLNGGVKYEAKNPGSRAGVGNSQLTAIRNLKKATDPKDPRYEMIVECEAKCLAEIAASKEVKIDYSKLPEALRAKFEAAAK